MKVNIGMDLVVEVDEAWYELAKKEFAGYKKRNPFDRFKCPESEIVGLIASTYQREAKATDQRGLIGCMVNVPGKGWS